jgi:2-polyprenyl-6-methoxyphenol hydroxylase-like FAD-dependent oxidoreductase
MASAIELAGRGVAVDLVEIDPNWRSYGAGISLNGAIFRVFRQLGIMDDFLAQGFAADGAKVHAPHGQLIAEIPTPRVAGAEYPGGGAIMRPVLARILAERTRGAGVNVVLGETFASIDAGTDGVEVTFQSGRGATYDLLIGADGLFSSVRARLFPAAPAPRFVGQSVWRTVVPRDPEVRCVSMWVAPKVKLGMHPVSKDQMYIFITVDEPTKPDVSPRDMVGTVHRLLEPFDFPLLDRVRPHITTDSAIVYRPLEALLMPRPWSAGRVVLIGDAVHATTPHMAAGACLGMEDAVVLVDELAKTDALADALSAFEQRRWERCRTVVENSLRLAEIEIQNGDKREHTQVMQQTAMTLAGAV